MIDYYLVAPEGATLALGRPGKPMAGMTTNGAIADEAGNSATPAEMQASKEHTEETGNPHGTTALQVNADPAGRADTVMSAHLADPNPHPQYGTGGGGSTDEILNDSTVAGTTATDALETLDSTKEATGTAAAAVSAHEGALDPHTQYEKTATKGEPNGYAELDSTGKVPTNQIPAVAISDFLGDVGSQVEMLALRGEKGDWCIRTDLGQTFIIIDGDGSLIGNWKDLPTPSVPVVSVNGQTGPVVLDAGDVGADPAGAAAAAQAASDPVGAAAAAQAASDPVGTATAAVGAHVAAVNPHPQYSSGSWQQVIRDKVEQLNGLTPTVIVTGLGANDLRDAIDAAAANAIIEIQTNATYNPIDILPNKPLTITSGYGFSPIITGSQGIRLLDGAHDVIIDGLTLVACTGGGNGQGAAIALEDRAKVQDITFCNTAIRDTASGPGAMLSYHDSNSNSIPIASILGDGTTVTFTTARAYSLKVGMTVKITATGYTGTYVINGVSSSYRSFTALGSSTAAQTTGTLSRNVVVSVVGDGTTAVVTMANDFNFDVGSRAALQGTSNAGFNWSSGNYGWLVTGVNHNAKTWTFANATVGSATGGVVNDDYQTVPVIYEMSERIAFINCQFSRASTTGVEYASLFVRAQNKFYVKGCRFDSNLVVRGIACVHSINVQIEDNLVLNSGGGGEAIKCDILTTVVSDHRTSGLIQRNRIVNALEGIDLDDATSVTVQNNVVSNCSVVGIAVDGGTPFGTGTIMGNVCYNCGKGIELEASSLADLSNNCCFNNTTNYSILNGYVLPASNTTDGLNAPEVFAKYTALTVGDAAKWATSGPTDVKTAIDRIAAAVVALQSGTPIA